MSRRILVKNEKWGKKKKLSFWTLRWWQSLSKTINQYYKNWKYADPEISVQPFFNEILLKWRWLIGVGKKRRYIKFESGRIKWFLGEVLLPSNIMCKSSPTRHPGTWWREEKTRTKKWAFFAWSGYVSGFRESFEEGNIDRDFILLIVDFTNSLNGVFWMLEP